MDPFHYHYATTNVLGTLHPLHELTYVKDCYHAVYSYMDVLCLPPSLLLYNQVERFGKPTWRRLVEAAEDPAGGNNHGLALKIAAEHPGMQLYTNTY